MNATDISRGQTVEQRLLNHRQQQHPFRGDDRERITSALQPAEALFTPNRQFVGPSVSDCLPSAEQSARNA